MAKKTAIMLTVIRGMAPSSQLLYFPTDTFLNGMRLLGGRALVAPVSQVVAASLTGQL
jgi:hypothetical protein